MAEEQDVTGGWIKDGQSISDWLKQPSQQAAPAPAYQSPAIGQDESLGDWLARGVNEQDPALTVALNNGVKVPPDRAARILKAQVKSGYDPAFIDRNLDYVEQEIRKSGFDVNRLRAGSPATAQFLKEYPDRVGLFAADLQGLTDTEKLLSQAWNPDIYLRPFSNEEVKSQAVNMAESHAEDVRRTYVPGGAEEWRKTYTSTPELVQHYEDQIRADEEFVSQTGKLGAGEASQQMLRDNPLAWTPFFRAAPSIAKAIDLREANKRVGTSDERKADQEFLTREWRKQIALIRRGTTPDAEMAQLLITLPALLTELAATGPAGRAAEAGIARTAASAGDLAAAAGSPGIVAKVGGIATQTALMEPAQILDKAIRRMTPEGQPEADANGNFTYHVKSDTGESIAVAVPMAALSSLFDVASMHVSLNPIYKLWAGKVAAPTVDGFFKTVARQGVEGALSGITVNEGLKLAKALANIEPYQPPSVESLVGQGAVFAGLGAVHGIAQVRAKTAQDKINAESQQKTLASVSDTVKNMDAFKKAPEIVEQALAAQVKDTPQAFVKLNPYEFTQYFQSKGIVPNDFATELTGRADALTDALNHGTPLQVPTSAYITKIGATDHGAYWQDKALFDPTLPKPSDAQMRLAKIDAQMEAERKAAKESATIQGGDMFMEDEGWGWRVEKNSRGGGFLVQVKPDGTPGATVYELGSEDAKRVMAGARRVPAAKAGPGDVKDFASIQGKDVAAQAEAAGRPKQEATLIGRLVEAVYRTLGIRGSTPAEEMGQKVGPIIQQGEGGVLEQTKQGGYVPPDITKSQGLINAFKSADPSTVPHELAHHFLDILANDPKLSDVFGKFLKAQGIESPEAWQQMTLEQRRPHHEAFAQAYENWLLEGKAPSAALRKTFFKYREMLSEVYQKQGKARQPISPEVRDVFERLHATDTEIANARARLGRLEPFTENAPNIVHDAEFADKIASLRADANAAAVERLDAESLADVNAARKTDSENVAIREQIKEDAVSVVDGRKDIQARAYLERGTKPDGSQLPIELGPPLKLNEGQLREQYGADALKGIPKEGLVSDGGVSADFLAREMGFSSGDEMLQAVRNAPDREQTLNDLIKQKLSERFGKLDTLPEEARKAIHNDSEQKISIYEMEWLAKNKLPQLKELLRRFTNPTRYLRDVREYAESKVSGLSFRLADPRDYESGEIQARRQAREALLKGDWESAIALKEREVLNAELYRAATNSRTEAGKIVQEMRKTGASDYRSMMFKAGPQYLAQIDAINDRFSFRNASTDRVERLKSLREFAESLADDGYISQIPDKLLNEAYKQNWKDVPFKDLVDIRDAVDNLEHLANLKNELREGQKRRSLDATAGEVADSIAANSSGKKPRAVSSYRRDEQGKRSQASAALTVRNLSDILREMDGFKDGGALQQHILRRFNEAGTDEARRSERDLLALQKAFDEYSKSEQVGFYVKKFIPEIKDSLSKEECIMIAATLGQEGATQRLLDGRGWGPEQIDAIKRQLTEKDWRLVKSLHEIVGADRAEVAKKMEEETGLPAKMVQPVPIETPFGEIEGGYLPWKYDFRLSPERSEVPEVEEARRAMQAAGLQATTRHGFREARTTGVKLPLRMDFGVIFEHLTEKNHDLAYHGALRDVKNLLNHEKVKQAIFDHAGQQTFEAIAKNVADIAVGEKGAENAIEKVFGALRRGTVASTMAFNVMQFFTDLGGITQGMRRVGSGWVLGAMKDFMGSPTKIKDMAEQILADSEFMRLRTKTRNREIFEVKNRIQEKGKAEMYADLGLEKLTGGKIDAQDLHDFSYYLMSRAQMLQEMPVWLGAFKKAQHDFPAEAAKGDAGFADAKKKWVSIADQAVLDSYGGGQMKDLSGLQKGNPIKRLVLATFYGFSGRTFAQLLESFKSNYRGYKRGELSGIGATGKVIADVALLYTIPALYMTAVKYALTSGDDKDSFLEKASKDQVGNFVSSLPVLRELAPAVQGRDYSGPAGLRFFSSAAGATKKIAAGDFPNRELLQMSGALFNLPALQIQRTVDGIEALSEGRTENPLAPIFGAHRKP